ncbi:putative U box domain, Zinc finger, RING/FYVE/PHD-type [Helianthus anomalus]
MPMYTGGQVLDLETAVKDGILGGDGGGVICSDVSTPNLVKLDLKKMIEQLDLIGEVDVPTVFICPISFEPMQDPVTLCTGQKPLQCLSLLVGVLRLMKGRRHPPRVLAGLRLLKIISSQQSLGNSIISIGGVQHLVEMLPQFNSECLELSLYVLEIMFLRASTVMCFLEVIYQF